MDDLKSVKDPVFQEDVEDWKRPNSAQYSRAVSLVLGLLTLAAAGVGAYYFLDKDEIDLQKGASQHDNFLGTVAMTAIVEHAEPEDCWLAIHGNVYDLTEYAPIHPGEPTLITRHCGTDATTQYDFEHSLALLPIVNEFLLGTLQEEGEEEEEEEATPSPTTPTIADDETVQQEIEESPATPPAPTESTVPPPPTPSPTESDITLAPVGTDSPTEAQSGCPMEFYTLADIAEHPDEESCWYALYGVVYDFTDYIDDHKGGRGTILAECGTDATEPFILEKKHDVDLLIKKGFSTMIIGRLGTTRETGRVACDEVDLVAVTTIEE